LQSCKSCLSGEHTLFCSDVYLHYRRLVVIRVSGIDRSGIGYHQCCKIGRNCVEIGCGGVTTTRGEIAGGRLQHCYLHAPLDKEPSVSIVVLGVGKDNSRPSWLIWQQPPPRSRPVDLGPKHIGNWSPSLSILLNRTLRRGFWRCTDTLYSSSGPRSHEPIATQRSYCEVG
jgi:hypothetical protein